MNRPEAEPVQAVASSPWLRPAATPEPAEDASPPVADEVAQRMAKLREVARYRSLAMTQRRLWFFYLEHNLFDEARATRLLMLEHLRSAGQQWRFLLGGRES